LTGSCGPRGETEKSENNVQKQNVGFVIRWELVLCIARVHAWKACNRRNRFGGSNPPLSAETQGNKGILNAHHDGWAFLVLNNFAPF